MLKKRAFTLIEVSLAMAILLIGIVGVATLVPVSINASMRAKNIATATILAESTMENIKTNATASSTNWDHLSNVDQTPFPSPYDNFKWTTTVDNTIPDVLKRVKLSIIWTERTKTLNEDFYLYIAKR